MGRPFWSRRYAFRCHRASGNRRLLSQRWLAALDCAPGERLLDVEALGHSGGGLRRRLWDRLRDVLDAAALRALGDDARLRWLRRGRRLMASYEARQRVLPVRLDLGRDGLRRALRALERLCPAAEVRDLERAQRARRAS